MSFDRKCREDELLSKSDIVETASELVASLRLYRFGIIKISEIGVMIGHTI